MPNTKTLAEVYKDAVETALGFVAKIDDDGDVVFKHPEFGTFFFNLQSENDPEYLMLVFPAFYDAMQGLALEDVQNVCNGVNRTCKGAKVWVLDNPDGDVYAVVEMVVAAPDTPPEMAHLAAVLPRALSLLTNAVRRFANDVAKLQEGHNEQKPVMH